MVQVFNSTQPPKKKGVSMDPGAINLVYKKKKKKKKKRFAATKQYLLFPSLSVAGYGC